MVNYYYFDWRTFTNLEKYKYQEKEALKILRKKIINFSSTYSLSIDDILKLAKRISPKRYLPVQCQKWEHQNNL